MKCFTMSATKCIILRPFYKLFTLYLLKKQHFKSKYQEACFSLKWLVATEVFILYAPFESSQEKNRVLHFKRQISENLLICFDMHLRGLRIGNTLLRRKNPSFIRNVTLSFDISFFFFWVNKQFWRLFKCCSGHWG